MKKLESNVWVQFSFIATHHYPEAATNPELSNYRWLANEHRHIFKLRVAIEVFHDNRDVEFLMFKDWLQSLYTRSILQKNSQSCEMIADALAEQINLKYPGRKLSIEVSEDGENGSYTSYQPD